jgi:hypothetical protein
MPQLTKVMNLGSLSLPEMLNLSPGLTVLVMVLMFALVLYVIERTHAARPDKLNSPENTPPASNPETQKNLSHQGTD